MNVGLAFLAGVYIPFHTYRIHLVPFISIIAAFRKKQLRILWHKIPAQIMGAFLGMLIFSYINDNTTKISLVDINGESLSTVVTAVINGIVTAVLCYSFYIVRVFFKAKKITGTLVLSFIIAMLFYFTAHIEGVSALNPFGILVYDLANGTPLYGRAWYEELLIHFISPIVFASIVFYLVKDLNKKKIKVNTNNSKLKNIGLRVETKPNNQPEKIDTNEPN